MSSACRGGGAKDVDRIKGPWSPEEDDALQRLMGCHDARNWSLISKSIPGRSGKSCRLRWCNQLSPQVEHRPFTPDEDDTILCAHARFGNKWATIDRLLCAPTTPSRTTGTPPSSGSTPPLLPLLRVLMTRPPPPTTTGHR